MKRISIDAEPKTLEEAQLIDEELSRIANNFLFENPSFTIEPEEEEGETMIFHPQSGTILKEKYMESEETKKDVIEVVQTKPSLIEKMFLRQAILEIAKDIENKSNELLNNFKVAEAPSHVYAKIKESIREQMRSESNLYRNLLLEEDYLNNSIITKDMEKEINAKLSDFVLNLHNLSKKVNIKTIEEYETKLYSLEERIKQLEERLEKKEQE